MRRALLTKCDPFGPATRTGTAESLMAMADYLAGFIVVGKRT
jgi:hypothetical protein